jgi:transposase InsO family protein
LLAKGPLVWVTDAGTSLDADLSLTRVLAQVEVTFSNSMIEAFWRSLKHSWIFLHSLDNFTALGRLIEFYVTAHNEVMPHERRTGPES